MSYPIVIHHKGHGKLHVPRHDNQWGPLVHNCAYILVLHILPPSQGERPIFLGSQTMSSLTKFYQNLDEFWIEPKSDRPLFSIYLIQQLSSLGFTMHRSAPKRGQKRKLLTSRSLSVSYASTMQQLCERMEAAQSNILVLASKLGWLFWALSHCKVQPRLQREAIPCQRIECSYVSVTTRDRCAAAYSSGWWGGPGGALCPESLAVLSIITTSKFLPPPLVA
jgi:hypothetical protein